MKSTLYTTRIPDMQAMRSYMASLTLDPKLKKMFEGNDFDSIEQEVMDHLSEHKNDYDYFLPAIQRLHKKKKTEEAEFFTGELIESNEGESEKNECMNFLCAILSFWPTNSAARKMVLQVLRKSYPHSTSFDILAEALVSSDADRVYESLEKLEHWLHYDIDQGVYTPMRGVGKVVELNPPLGTIRVTFGTKGNTSESFRIEEAMRLLEPLSADHFLLQKLENPHQLAELAEHNEGELLARLFESVQRTITSTELKEMLQGIIPANRWSTWWAKARKHPQLTVGSGKPPQCSWKGSVEEANAALEGIFNQADPREKLDLARKSSGRSLELNQKFADILIEESERLQEDDPVLALEMLLTISKMEKVDTGDAWARAAALCKSTDAVSMISGMKDRGLRKQGVTLVRSEREDWESQFLQLLRFESDGQTLAYMYDELGGIFGNDLCDRLVNEVIAKPSEAPRFYLWLSGELLKRDELKTKVNWTYLHYLLRALTSEDMKAYHALMRKFFDIDGVAIAALKTIDHNQAQQISAMLDRNTGLEEYRVDDLRGRLKSMYPHLNRDDDTDLFYVTLESLQQKRVDFDTLVTKELPQNAKDIETARAHGDLRENFEYHAARARQELLSSQAKSLDEQLQNARILDPASVDPSSIAPGTVVQLISLIEGKPDRTLTILGPWDSDPSRDIVSYTAPAADAILGAAVGDTIDYDNKKYRITSIVPWK